ncbi:MAG TPA: DUF5522 domain-containing protein [Puia sp.]|nr:DUF5522 domain-containing protein [Puia sp.]
MKPQFIEGEDYYYNEEGYIVLTEKYHLEKGYCCGNGCRHCPYDYENVPEPGKSALLKKRQDEDNRKRN